MQSSDDINDSVITADLFGIFDNVADAGMGAAGNNDEPLAGTIDERGIIDNPISALCPLSPADREACLKSIAPRNLTQKHQF